MHTRIVIIIKKRVFLPLFKICSNVFSLILFFMNLYLILHVSCQINFLDFLIIIFISSLKFYRNSVFGSHRRAQIPIIKKIWSASRGAPPPTPRRGLRPLRPSTRCLPHTSSLSPYIPSHLRLAGVVSHLRAYTRYIKLYTENKITYATRAYFFTHSGNRRGLVAGLVGDSCAALAARA